MAFKQISLFCRFRCAIKSILGATLGCFPAPSNCHLHEARLAWWRPHQLLPGPIQRVWLTRLEGCQVTQHSEWVWIFNQRGISWAVLNAKDSLENQTHSIIGYIECHSVMCTPLEMYTCSASQVFPFTHCNNNRLDCFQKPIFVCPATDCHKVTRKEIVLNMVPVSTQSKLYLMFTCHME